jgi:hypothetical protein
VLRPRGVGTNIAVARVPARDKKNRIGSLIFNFGGPGGAAVDDDNAPEVGYAALAD